MEEISARYAYNTIVYIRYKVLIYVPAAALEFMHILRISMYVCMYNYVRTYMIHIYIVNEDCWQTTTG